MTRGGTTFQFSMNMEMFYEDLANESKMQQEYQSQQRDDVIPEFVTLEAAQVEYNRDYEHSLQAFNRRSLINTKS